jgi:uracil-DNA glycosylase family 4
MIVGEAPGVEEDRIGLPFQGTSGQELNRMLSEAGIARNECFLTNVCRVRPANNDINLFFAKYTKDRKYVTPNHKLFRNRYCLPPIIDG